jgi:hypothetical protein
VKKYECVALCLDAGWELEQRFEVWMEEKAGEQPLDEVSRLAGCAACDMYPGLNVWSIEDVRKAN